MSTATATPETSAPVATELRSGRRVRVWWEPVARRNIEGLATLVSRKHGADSNGNEVWYVRFPGCDGTVERIVRVDDVMG